MKHSRNMSSLNEHAARLLVMGSEGESKQSNRNSITGQSRRGQSIHLDFVNRNLISQMPEVLAWDEDDNIADCD